MNKQKLNPFAAYEAKAVGLDKQFKNIARSSELNHSSSYSLPKKRFIWINNVQITSFEQQISTSQKPYVVGSFFVKKIIAPNQMYDFLALHPEKHQYIDKFFNDKKHEVVFFRKRYHKFICFDVGHFEILSKKPLCNIYGITTTWTDPNNKVRETFSIKKVYINHLPISNEQPDNHMNKSIDNYPVNLI